MSKALQSYSKEGEALQSTHHALLIHTATPTCLDITVLTGNRFMQNTV
jgi:hypothetical protein